MNIEREVDKFVANMPFHSAAEGIALALVIFYSSTLAMKLPPQVMVYMATTPAKIAALAFVISMTSKKPVFSVALAVGVFATLNVIQHRGFWEQFSGEYEVAPFQSAEKIVAGPELKNAMFKTRQRQRLAKDAARAAIVTDGTAAGVLADDNLFQTAPYGFEI